MFIVILMFALYSMRGESFSAQRRATDIASWFHGKRAPSFTDYRLAIPHSNIVEYETVLGLYQSADGTVTIDDIEQVL